MSVYPSPNFFNFHLVNIDFLRRFGNFSRFLKKYSSSFQKIGFNGKSGHSFACLHTPLSSFYLASLSTALEKVWGIFDPNFWIFIFSRKVPSQICDFGFIG